ncbi:hypothetical protein BpHYR1_007911 [Brachionus plicatilis]|uniref:Uncharacterized protein n=1 Tax=Brachionus plicatilis TaxID=10195 RepID=A0A3M7QJA5_BRAPC|nr:hypothetical protein BpHYR1_007911 [Brachionus plicatilis]
MVDCGSAKNLRYKAKRKSQVVRKYPTSSYQKLATDFNSKTQEILNIIEILLIILFCTFILKLLICDINQHSLQEQILISQIRSSEIILDDEIPNRSDKKPLTPNIHQNKSSND